MFPKSLSHDPLRSGPQWLYLSEKLFDDLLDARADSTPPEELWKEWGKWDHFTTESIPNAVRIVGKDMAYDWLRAYEMSFAPDCGEGSSYVRGVASLLRGGRKKAHVPIVVVPHGKDALVLRLEVFRVENGSGQQWLHPAFEHRRADVNAGNGAFAEGMSRAWEAARTNPDLASLDIFWRVRSADGYPLPDMKLDGPSASAAAYRAFWRIARGKHIEPDVYVLADATASDARIQAVGDLRKKIRAVKASRSPHSIYPPTLIVAEDVPTDDIEALDTARKWADVKAVATRDDLATVRSCWSPSHLRFSRFSPLIAALALLLSYLLTVGVVEVLRDIFEGMPYSVPYSAGFGSLLLVVAVFHAITIIQREAAEFWWWLLRSS